MHPLKKFPSLPRLVRLQMPYQMPRGVKIGKLVHFCRRFLHTILADISQARSVGLTNRWRRLCFTDCHQTNILAPPAAAQTCSDDSLFNPRDVVWNACGHFFYLTHAAQSGASRTVLQVESGFILSPCIMLP